MAPRAGRRGAGTQRGGPGKPRGGGITKQRGTPRVDKDGDVAMDVPVNAPTGPSGGRGRGRGRGRDGSSQPSTRLAQNIQSYLGSDGSKPQFNKTTLKIFGLKNSKAASNADGGVRSLLEFLERKASREKTITLGKGTLVGDCVWVKASKADAPNLIRLSGYTFAGAELTIEETQEPIPFTDGKAPRAATSETKQKLTAVLAARYNAEQKLLDLSSLGTDETLKSLGTFESQALAEKSFKALVHLAGSEYKDPEERRVAIQAVSLARNDIRDVEEVYALAKSLRHLRRLDLSGNNLENLAKLSKWRDEFRYLEELHLAGNPVANQPNYAAEMVNWFPCLQILDGQQVRTPEQAAEALKAMSPSPVPQFPSNVRDGDNGVAGIFLRTFFPLFDNDRSALAAQFYDEDSWFSLAIIASSGRDLPWQKYQKFSRNVQKLGSRNPASLQRLFTGGNLIADLWKSLPNTQHPSVDQPEQWLIDCHTFPHLADPNSLGTAVGLIINVNGQFEEADPADGLRGIRTFSRTFILGPSKIGAPHPYRVISDELTLHKWTPQPVQAVQPIQPVQPVQPVQPNALPSDALKAQLIMELSKRTGMNAQYSEMCLTGAANWNFDMALRSFEEQRANLPPAAFISPAA